MGRNLTTYDWISLGSRLTSSGHCSVARTVTETSGQCAMNTNPVILKEEKVSFTGCVRTARVAEDLQHREKKNHSYIRSA